MNPADKHLAIRTEDHPLEYAEIDSSRCLMSSQRSRTVD